MERPDGYCTFPYICTFGADEQVDIQRSGVGGVRCTTAPIHAQTQYVPLDAIAGEYFFIDKRIFDDKNTSLAIASALQLFRTGHTCYLSLVDFPFKRLAGASCGLAACLASMGVVSPHVAVTGFFQGFGFPSLNVMPVDLVEHKVKMCILRRIPLIVPADTTGAPTLSELVRRREVTYYGGMLTNEGYDVFPIGLASNLADLGYVLNAMDPDVDLSVFKPQTQRSPDFPTWLPAQTTPTPTFGSALPSAPTAPTPQSSSMPLSHFLTNSTL